MLGLQRVQVLQSTSLERLSILPVEMLLAIAPNINSEGVLGDYAGATRGRAQE